MKIRIVLLLCVLLVGCSTNANLYKSGETFDVEKADTIRLGMSPETVLEIMGTSPYHVDKQAKVETWTWVHTDNNITDNTKIFAVNFIDKKVYGTTLKIGGYSKSDHNAAKQEFNIQ